MTPKEIRFKKVSRDRYALYWEKAMEFFEAMVDASQKKNRNATGLAGVHCCISATDALLVKRAGIRAQKNLIEYVDKSFPEKDAQALKISVERYIDWVRKLLAGSV